MLEIDGDISIECKTIIEKDKLIKRLFERLNDSKGDECYDSLLQEIATHVSSFFNKRFYFAIDHTLDNHLLRFKNIVKNVIEMMLCKTTLSSLPLTLHIEVTNKCDISCIMCGRSFKSASLNSAYRKKEIKYEDMSFDVFKKAESLFPYIAILPLVGWGEPFVSPYFYKMLRRSKEFGVGVNFTTNGMHLGNENFLNTVYINRNVFSIGISFDGATEATFNLIRRGAQFHKVIDNIFKINELKEKHTLNNPELYFSFVAMKKNIEELCLLIDLAAKLNICVINVTYLAAHGETIRKESLFYHKDLANKIFEEAKKKAQEKGILLNLPECFKKEKSIDEFSGKDNSQLEKITNGFLCTYPWTFAMIKANGDVLPCCAYEESFGNITNESFRKIWNNKKFRSLRKSFRDGNIPDFCRSCNRFGDVNNESSHIHLV